MRVNKKRPTKKATALSGLSAVSSSSPSSPSSSSIPGKRTSISSSTSNTKSKKNSSLFETQPSTKSGAESSNPQIHQRYSSSSTSSSPQPLQSQSPSDLSKPSPSSFPPNLFNPSSHGSSSSSKPIPLPPEPFSVPSTSGHCADLNDSSSSRPQSPEDLSMPGASRVGRMSGKHRKKRKNMTNERRLENNAKERVRFQTLSAALETLRRTLPSYSHNQKMPKIAILKTAYNYIASLATLRDMDYTSVSGHAEKPCNFPECVKMTTKAIQAGGRAKRKH
ncbi:protein atonal homolog 8-like [Elysia marginata]|uniref:Protein atonal homolog 8-like n=1 Tax=Elysia marginata TaxID=1093978 RepID=A0AAV4GXW7_9GAST|nr:protein atonal homolog 8-like [Elysia marginata]